MKITKKQICDNCHHYIEFYTKSLDHFNKTNHGKCRKYNKQVGNKENCEQWKDNREKRELRKELSLQTLNEAITYIREIAQILEEETVNN